MNQTDMGMGIVSILIGELNSQYCQIMNINILSCNISIKFQNSIGIIIGIADEGGQHQNQDISIINIIIDCIIVSEYSSGGFINYIDSSNIIIHNSVFSCSQSGYVEFGGYIQEQRNTNTTISNSQFTNSTILNTLRFAGFVEASCGSNTTIADSSFTNINISCYQSDKDRMYTAGFVAYQSGSANTTLQKLQINNVNIEGDIDEIGGFVAFTTMYSECLIIDSIMSNSNITGKSYVGAFYDICKESTLKLLNSNITNVNLNGQNVAIFCAQPVKQDGNISVSKCFTKNVYINGVLQAD
ncbi:Hypothetical_protein [Hexamita inflata]|uniref:Hypothetical_protein n=1 Tax=Hexamita inflata TaxID=28002 RepID=A0AA86RHL7_9EUKA|nr:Hypothetical protein HINF_LOCUS54775 [Hexamita inflata]